MSYRLAGYTMAILAWTFIVTGCAGLTTKMDPPNITLESFDSLPSDGGGPRFLIKLRVQNPNEQQLDISGISYGIELVGTEVVTGVSNDVPVIDGYSEGIVTLEASLKLFQVLKLLASLPQTSEEELTYRFTAKIDFKGLVPTQRIEEEGQISLK